MGRGRLRHPHALANLNVADAAITAGAVLVVIALLVRPATLAAPGVASGETGPHND